MCAAKRNPWDAPASSLNQPDAQQRMYVLVDKEDEYRQQIAALDKLWEDVVFEKASLLKAHPTLLFRRDPSEPSLLY